MSFAGMSFRRVLLGAAAAAVLLIGGYLVAAALEGENSPAPVEPIAEAAERPRGTRAPA